MDFETFKFYAGEVVIPILAAVGGAVWGGRKARQASLEATAAAHRNALELHHQRVEAERTTAQSEMADRISAVLNAIEHEVVITMDAFKTQGGNELRNLPEKQPYEWMISLSEGYFMVYPKHTELVGQIKDAELVRLIILVYTKSNIFMDSLRINNQFLTEREHWWRVGAEREFDNQRIQNLPDPIGHRVKDAMNSNLVELAPSLKKQYNELEVAIADLKMRLNIYRNPDLAKLDWSKIGGKYVVQLQPDQIMGSVKS